MKHGDVFYHKDSGTLCVAILEDSATVDAQAFVAISENNENPFFSFPTHRDKKMLLVEYLNVTEPIFNLIDLANEVVKAIQTGTLPTPK